MKKLWTTWWAAVAFSAILILAGAAVVGGWHALGSALVVLGALGVVGCAVYATLRL